MFPVENDSTSTSIDSNSYNVAAYQDRKHRQASIAHKKTNMTKAQQDKERKVQMRIRYAMN